MSKNKKRNFLKIPEPVENKLKQITDPNIKAACVKSIPIAEIASGMFSHLGISLNNDGLIFTPTLLPSPQNGRASKTNIHGKVTVRRDLPKQNKSFSFEAPSWGDWSKGSHIITYTREVYPREFYAPREFELSIEPLAEYNGTQSDILIKFTVMTVLDKKQTHFKSDLLHALNLLQENVGAADVFASTADKDDYMKTIIVDWELLPTGDRNMVINKVMSSFRRKTDIIQAKIAARYDLLKKLGPTAFIQGTSGFRRYFGAKFGDNLIVFENIDYGNAIYIMFEDWEQLSKLSRLELLTRNPDGFVRIIHRKGWEHQLINIVTKRRQPKVA